MSTPIAGLNADSEPIYVHRTRSAFFVEPGFGPNPINTFCTNCSTQVITVCKSTPGLLTWIMASILCVFAFPCCCCFVPFCINDCLDVKHTCPCCRHVIGEYKRM